MNIPRMYTIALCSFGYTVDEARFLYIVATHSGYFTCQQYIRFIHGKPGKRSLIFVRKLLEKGHASARPCLRNGQVYHLFARNIYEAIGKENVRFRRKHSLEYIRTRLAALDFILGKLDYTFFETEQEKVGYFTEQLGIDRKYLPAKRYAGAIQERFTDRYFVDKFPIFLIPKVSPPVVSFSFVDPGLESLDSFHTHLQAYFPLFCQLASVKFHYVATRDTFQEHARRAFMRLFDRHWNPDAPGGLVDYFCLQKKEDLGKLHELSKADLATLKEGKAKFNRREITILYQRWRAEQVHFDQVRNEYDALRRPETVVFIFTPVNGQVALFERHPNSLVKTPWKSAPKEPFAGDFTASVTEAEP